MAPCSHSWSRGFAYIWLLIVVALMGLCAAMTLEVQQTVSQRDRERELLAIGQQFRNALSSYRQAGVGDRSASTTVIQPSVSVSGSSTFSALTSPADLAQYPASLEDLLKDGRFPGTRRHLRKVFVDPMTGKSEWGLVKVSGRIIGIHSLSQDAPIRKELIDVQAADPAGAESYAQWIFMSEAPPAFPPTSAAKP